MKDRDAAYGVNLIDTAKTVPGTIHITAELEQTIRAALREVDGRIAEARLKRTQTNVAEAEGWRQALAWVLTTAGLLPATREGGTV
jgi:hypothetical protein